jgi:hypothetical protein
VTYALVALVAVQAILMAYLVDSLSRRAARERQALEDRLMAMSNMDAFILNKANEKPTPGDVKYVDEEREWELSPGGGGYDSSEP